MTEQHKGILAMVLACILWGTTPLYYKLLTQVPPLEVLAHRTLWSAVIFLGLLAATGRLAALRPLLRGRRLAMVALAAGLISFNWFLFIFSVQAGHVIEAALGYYIFPLVAVALGVLAFGERLTPGQGVAVALAVGAVGVLTWGLGVAPWIALAIASSFGLYGLLKKRLAAPPVPSVTAEVLVLAPLSLIWLAIIATGNGPEAGHGHFLDSAGTAGLLVLSGALTASPLMLFTYATARVRLATVGLIQYINPTLQFLTATLIFAEPFGRWHAIAFGLIWAGLALYTLEGFRRDRAVRRAAVSAGTSATAAK
ncbi:MAG: RarD protein [Rhodobacterales bacterium 65-51]|jgi:chloramphenicol-sensitive protein RarD|uniref:EamA family transporter RarD n=1 Tax=uncultured Gemmobacter sp. TaxID=1095917 RepID=UPI00095A7088|nr:EamA family transporter RarD [uncultured Gemmobacter sp.]OJY27320.1 MAG: RarD protein [Rhodobacterales bacterium 65-51]